MWPDLKYPYDPQVPIKAATGAASSSGKTKTPTVRTDSNITLSLRLLTIDVRNLLDIPAGRILRDTTDVQDPQAGTIVGLVRETINDVLVVVNRHHGGLIDTGLDRFFQVRNVPDICSRPLVSCGTCKSLLVEFVIEEEELLVLGIEHPALVSVGGTFVGDAGDDVGGGLVGDVVDGQAVFVIACNCLEIGLAHVQS